MNVFFAVTESALLGGLPVRWSEISLAPLVGCAYVMFTWSMSMSWNKREHGPQVRHGIAVGTEKSLMFNRLQNCFSVYLFLFRHHFARIRPFHRFIGFDDRVADFLCHLCFLRAHLGVGRCGVSRKFDFCHSHLLSRHAIQRLLIDTMNQRIVGSPA